MSSTNGRGLIAACLAAAIVTSGADATTTATGPPSILTALPAIGTIYWRARCGPRVRWSLGLKAFRSSATDQVSFLANGHKRRRVLQPSGTMWFPFTGAKLQTIRVRQHTEPGLLRATV